jgi:hypothetical protein
MYNIDFSAKIVSAMKNWKIPFLVLQKTFHKIWEQAAPSLRIPKGLFLFYSAPKKVSLTERAYFSTFLEILFPSFGVEGPCVKNMRANLACLGPLPFSDRAEKVLRPTHPWGKFPYFLHNFFPREKVTLLKCLNLKNRNPGNCENTTY